MPESKHQHQQAAGKRKADNALSADGNASKRPTVKPEARLPAADLASGQSEEALFKIKHASEFDTESVAEDSGIRVKDEKQDDDTSALPLMRQERATPAIGTPRTVGGVSSSHEGTNQEGTLVSILSQGSWEFKMTELAIANLSHRARQAAARGQAFDVAYVNSIIERLDCTGIEAGRRSQVIELLKDEFRQSLKHWESCIDRLGSKRQLSPTSLPHYPVSATQDPKPRVTPTPSSSKTTLARSDSVISDNAVRYRHLPCSSDSSDATSDIEEANDDAASKSGYLEIQSGSSTGTRNVHSLSSNAGPSSITDWNKSTTNMRLYGTRCPKAAFDVFARCTISAWAAAPHPDDTSIKIREYALLRWRKVPWEQKSVWQKLHEDRHDPAVDVDYTGRRLLLTQDLLRVMVPENRFSAAKIHCQQPQAKHRAFEAQNSRLLEEPTPVKIFQRLHTRPATGGSLLVSDQVAPGGPSPSMC